MIDETDTVHILLSPDRKEGEGESKRERARERERVGYREQEYRERSPILNNINIETGHLIRAEWTTCSDVNMCKLIHTLMQMLNGWSLINVEL